MTTILVLDDDNAMRRFLTRMLRAAGYEVVDTGDADEALRLIQAKTAVDLLIADVRMPIFKPHGIAVGQAATAKRIKVIYISGGEVPQGFINPDKTPLLAKPIRQETLLASVAAALGDRPLSSEGR